MAASIAPRTMANCLALLLLLVTMVAGQGATVHPTNSSLLSSMTDPNITLDTNTQGNAIVGMLEPDTLFNIAPLTSFAGEGANQNQLTALNIRGSLKLADPETVGNLTQTNIAYVSCDPNSSNINASSVVNSAGNLHPKAILMYSLSSSNCNFSSSVNPPSYQSIYTMTSASDSEALFNYISTTSTSSSSLLASIASIDTGSDSNGSSNGGPSGPAPTTAVAMSILYSITGIITLLFLIIIATGAIRAHRHPERYGPRTGLAGRPRQSRAKGLARAMLETLPIVKFGDPEPVKQGSGDIELEDGAASEHSHHEIVAAPATVTAANTQPKPITETTAAEHTGMEGNTQAVSVRSQDVAATGAATEAELGCSICTEDFTTGEDVRVLPCHHKYHPACIDPWLLNVSGTCPLCRHDLRPAGAETEEGEGQNGEGELPPPLAEQEGAAENTASGTPEHRNRMTRFLDRNRLRHAPADERIAALRNLREQSRGEGEATPDVAEERSRRARLTGRLRDTFRIKTRSQEQ